MRMNFLRARPHRIAYPLILIALACACLGAWPPAHRRARPRTPGGTSPHWQTKQKEWAGSTIHGRAVYDDTGRPVRRGRVVLRSVTSFGPEELSGLTNVRGGFRVMGVPAGRYFIAVSTGGLISPESFINLDEHRESRFDLVELRKYFEEVEVDGKSDKELTVHAKRGGAISGKVAYANGDPAVDHPISVLRRKGIASRCSGPARPI